EMVFRMDQNGRIVIEPVHLVIEMTVLHIYKTRPALTETLLPFRIYIVVDLDRRFPVIPVIIGKTAVRRPGDIPVVLVVKTVPAAAGHQLGIVLFVLQRQNGTIEIIVQPALP